MNFKKFHLIAMLILFVISSFPNIILANENDGITVNKVEINSERNEITVAGSVYSGKYVTLRVKKISSNEDLGDASVLNPTDLYAVKQVAVDSSKGFSFLCVLKEDVPGGWYQAKVTSEDASAKGTFKKNIYYANTEEIQSAINAINNPNLAAANIHNVLEEYTIRRPILSLKIDYEQAFQQGIEKALLALRNSLVNSRFNNLSDIMNNYNKAIAITSINTADGNNLNTMFSLYNDGYFHLNLSGDYTFSAEVTTEAQRLFLLNRSKQADQMFGTTEVIKESFDKSVAIARVNKARLADMKEVLEKYNGIFGLDLDAAYKKYDSVEVNKALLGIGFNAIDEIRTAFSNRIEELGTPKSTGGGGGSSSSGKVSMGVTFEPAAVNNPNEAKPLFSDVEQSSWARESIEKLYERGIIKGYEDNTFRADAQIKREEFVKMVIEAFNMVDENARTDFQDVPQNEWYAKYIASAQAKGLTQGQGDNLFGSGTWVNRQDMALFIYRAINLNNLLLTQTSDPIEFKDSGKIRGDASDAIQSLQRANIIAGDENGMFEPDHFATRAQAAKMIYEAMKLIK